MTILDDFRQYRNAYFLALSVSMGSIFYGFDVGLIGGVLALESFQHYFGLDEMSPREKAALSGNIVVILQLGCLLGALGVGSFSSRYGRKPCLAASGIIFIVGSSIQVLVGLGLSRGYALSSLYWGRFLGGIGVGMVTALVPAYISECVPKAIRGRCAGLVQLAINFGIMLSFWVNYIVSKHVASTETQWRTPFAMQIIPGFLFLSLLPFQPESPRYMVEHEQYGRAAQTLAFLAHTTPDDEQVLIAVEEIKADFKGKRQLSPSQQIALMGETSGIALQCFIPSLVMFFQQITGTNAINYFSPQIFANLGIGGTSAELFATGVYGIVKVVSVAFALAFSVEGAGMGRKNSLVVGGLGQGAMMLLLWLGGLSRSTGALISTISIGAVYLYAVFYSIGWGIFNIFTCVWGPIPWVLAGEVAPNHLRTTVMSMASGTNWLLSLTVSKLTPIMLNELRYGTFLLFGCCCLLMSFWAWLCLPETAGYTLEEIGLLFEKDVIVRALQDAPGGYLFLGARFVAPIRSAAPADPSEEDRWESDGGERSNLLSH
ncbi:general substrate transporter [Roridomyces roridus]|uniref:General substrate transporter n=1 Tax=Roridomyces roridus TaxID=1738132 RepID=A0AAD7CAI0_9AGAR|nr:general substrate transporter [Roridomyces roridus]